MEENTPKVDKITLMEMLGHDGKMPKYLKISKIYHKSYTIQKLHIKNFARTFW